MNGLTFQAKIWEWIEVSEWRTLNKESVDLCYVFPLGVLNYYDVNYIYVCLAGGNTAANKT